MENNNFIDVHNLLLQQMKKLSDDKLCKNESTLKIQTDRAKAMCGLASQIVSLANAQVRALEVKGEYGFISEEMPEQLDVRTNK